MFAEIIVALIGVKSSTLNNNNNNNSNGTDFLILLLVNGGNLSYRIQTLVLSILCIKGNR